MELSLDELLEKAATGPADRPAFFRRLMQSDVWVAGKPAPDASLVFDPDYRQQLDGTAVIPFFTTKAAFTEVAGDGLTAVTLPVSQLFAMTSGHTLCLNPLLKSSKVFTATEVRSLCSGQGNALGEISIPAEGQTLLLSATEDPPSVLTDSLKQLFSRYKPVRRAFIAWCREDAQAEGNFLIGIEASADLDEIIQAAGHVAMDTLPENALIDFCEISDPSSGVSHFFVAHIPPFYQRPQGSFLRGAVHH
ncbi:enhanced serine sensitivity protein SseB C-terminal domain-containing protein [Tatumella sp. JGM118]|uniref:enhanced serine sensitivity protein SseB C-terminal domain-containing protein n=1 Tax=Tatumella sp. JGM118 TaxID=2799796 RepID=UPI001BB004AE|nr:enhanced serine sensitivity protein SseB C-terminal domain-containing protein [Tatumella sp. JGM118]MBS0909035.1 enhanced serine sensitivity protein SseB C-terminal domain-containing protein [Tatumella sp. JGM118]